MGHASLGAGGCVKGATRLTRQKTEEVMDQAPLAQPTRAAVREGRLRVPREAGCGRPDKRRGISPV